MSESNETSSTTTESAVLTQSRNPDDRDRRLNRTLAWVGIVAGVVFTVAVIFFSGLAVGRASTGYHQWHRGYQGEQMGPGGCPMMRGGMTGPGGGMMGPGMKGPGMMGPGMMGPGGMEPDDMGPGMMRPGPSSAPPASPPTAQR